MEYRCELHFHTAQVSPCGKVTAQQGVELYLQRNYSSIVVTDHFSDYAFEGKGLTTHTRRVEHFLSGWQAAKAAAKGRMHVLLGMEICLRDSKNDYLIYGLNEGFLQRQENLLDLNVRQLSQLVRENGMLMFQAHPFRNHMTVTNPALLDGIEVYNGNGRHDSRNDIADQWARKYNLLMSSGSDFHQTVDTGRGGMVTTTKIENNQMLLMELKKRPRLIRSE